MNDQTERRNDRPAAQPVRDRVYAAGPGTGQREVTRDTAARERAEALLDFVRLTFFDHRNNIVQERVSSEAGTMENHYEPGHSMEWVWLLGWRSRLFDIPLDPFASWLYELYCSAGIPEGRTPMGLTADQNPVDPTCRLWSQTESLKAHLTIVEMGAPEL